MECNVIPANTVQSAPSFMQTMQQILLGLHPSLRLITPAGRLYDSLAVLAHALGARAGFFTGTILFQKLDNHAGDVLAAGILNAFQAG